jgi:hypothetical protein
MEQLKWMEVSETEVLFPYIQTNKNDFVPYARHPVRRIAAFLTRVKGWAEGGSEWI